jgi:hypothetical protein
VANAGSGRVALWRRQGRHQLARRAPGRRPQQHRGPLPAGPGLDAAGRDPVRR